ncbi:RNA binding (RRM/RBD/RNP motifs) family protein [Striga asiatica]|uniref:RNA binding (RRM/RBD/RNP motifs) family protein n=1 Tax=Striga asiatica TaxID=4170 RepID=A0A5A7PLH1_STRAF|nr:RNA binding (RRM/RBD/RNP motifs) family protein [Striga asiatica]
MIFVLIFEFFVLNLSRSRWCLGVIMLFRLYSSEMTKRWGREREVRIIRCLGKLIFKELREEGKFLKVCGTLLEETPVEIRKGIEKREAKLDSPVGSSRRYFKLYCIFLDSPFEVLKQFGFLGSRSVVKPSPYPTLLKSSNEVQTPGSEFPALHNDGKIKSKDEYSDSNGERTRLRPWKEDDVISTPVAKSAAKQISVKKEMKMEASLSNWLKPVSQNKGGRVDKFSHFSREKDYFGETPKDRPILGMMAAHWNENEISHVSPKWWDGNGIPNCTNKYKEDQKVNWHATPFEERLEKALSEETFISKRKTIGMTSEEFDTAFPHMQSLDSLKSVVSYG